MPPEKQAAFMEWFGGLSVSQRQSFVDRFKEQTQSAGGLIPPQPIEEAIARATPRFEAAAGSSTQTPNPEAEFLAQLVRENMPVNVQLPTPTEDFLQRRVLEPTKAGGVMAYLATKGFTDALAALLTMGKIQEILPSPGWEPTLAERIAQGAGSIPAFAGGIGTAGKALGAMKFGRAAAPLAWGGTSAWMAPENQREEAAKQGLLMWALLGLLGKGAQRIPAKSPLARQVVSRGAGATGLGGFGMAQGGIEEAIPQAILGGLFSPPGARTIPAVAPHEKPGVGEKPLSKVTQGAEQETPKPVPVEQPPVIPPPTPTEPVEARKAPERVPMREKREMPTPQGDFGTWLRKRGIKSLWDVSGPEAKGLFEEWKKEMGWTEEEAIIQPPKVEQPPPSRKGAGGGKSAGFPIGATTQQPKPTEARAEVIRKSKIVEKVVKALERPIRVGRFREKALGIYKIKPEAIRLKKANDIEVMSHEVGHHLHKLFWGFGAKAPKGREALYRPGPIQNELIALGKALYGSRKPPYGGYTAEGIAEYVRLYATDPARAPEKAPNFHKFFEGEIEKYPDMKNMLTELRKDWQNWQSQPAVEKVKAHISVGEREGRLPNLHDLYTYTVDELHPIKKFVDSVTQGKDLVASQDPYVLARTMAGWTGKAEHFLRRGTLAFKDLSRKGKSLEEILGPLEKAGTLDDFRAFITSRRALEYSAQGMESGIEPEVAREALRTLEAKHPEFEAQFTELKDYNDALLRYVRDSGLMSQEIYQKIKALNLEYVPFYRLSEQKPGIRRGSTGRTFADIFSPVRRRKGSGAEILDPIESIVKNTYTYINAAERNRVAVSMGKLAGIEGTGYWIEEVPVKVRPVSVEVDAALKELRKRGFIAPEEGTEKALGELINIFKPKQFAPEANIITAVTGGKRTYYRVQPDLYKAVKSLDAEEVNILMRILSIPARTLRIGATGLSPEFALLRNPWKDQFVAFLQSKYGYKPIIDLPRAVFHILKKDDMYWDWVKSGGQHTMLVSLDRTSIQKNLRDVVRSGALSGLRNAIRHPVETVRILSEVTEAATRVGEFEHAKKALLAQGQSELSASLGAAMASREVSLDFARKGAKAKAMNKITAFFNASVQGYDKMVRTFREKPISSSVKAAVAITLPSIYLALSQKDDHRWKEIPQWQRDLFWIVLSDKHVYKIPKPFEWGIIFGSIPERIIDHIVTKDPAAADDILQTIARMAPPPLVPTAIGPIIENYANWSMFRDRPIVPRGMEEKLPEYQHDRYASETARVLGRWMNYSPAKIDNLIYGYTGGFGRYVTSALDVGLKPETAPEPSRVGADYPLARAFVGRYPSASSENIERFYEYRDKAEQVKQSIAMLAREGKREEAYKLYEEHKGLVGGGHADPWAMYKTLTRTADALSNMRKSVDKIDRSKDMTPEQKRREIDRIYIKMNQRAAQTLRQVRVR